MVAELPMSMFRWWWQSDRLMCFWNKTFKTKIKNHSYHKEYTRGGPDHVPEDSFHDGRDEAPHVWDQDDQH